MKELNDSNAALMLGGRNKFVASNWVVGMLYYRFSSVISKKGINLLHINLSYLYYDEYKSKKRICKDGPVFLAQEVDL